MQYEDYAIDIVDEYANTNTNNDIDMDMNVPMN